MALFTVCMPILPGKKEKWLQKMDEISQEPARTFFRNSREEAGVHGEARGHAAEETRLERALLRDLWLCAPLIGPHRRLGARLGHRPLLRRHPSEISGFFVGPPRVTQRPPTIDRPVPRPLYELALSCAPPGIVKAAR